MTKTNRRGLLAMGAGVLASITAASSCAKNQTTATPPPPIPSLNLIKDELTYSGAASFAASQTPASPVCVYRNGLIQSVAQGDYTISVGTITPTLAASWVEGDSLVLVYLA